MFSDIYIKNLQPNENGTPYRVFEKENDPGFCVQVTPAGKKTFQIYFKREGKQHFYSLGSYNNKFGVKAARSKCREIRSLLEKGIDPDNEKYRTKEREKKEKAEIKRKANRITLNKALDSYLRSLTTERTRKNTSSQFDKDVRPFLGERIVEELTAIEISRVINSVVKRGSQASARNLYISLNAAINAAQRDPNQPELEHWANPMLRVKKPSARPPGDNALSPEEIAKLWQSLAIGKLSKPIADIIRLLLLTGQRVREITELRWSEIDLKNGFIDLPPSRIKTGTRTRKGHVIPLAPMAKKILSECPRMGLAVFPGARSIDQPMSWESVRKAINKHCKEMKNIDAEFPIYSPKQSRSTVKTHMARIKILKEIRDRIQNHALHDVASTHYDRHDYFDDKLDGLKKWEAELTKIIGSLNGVKHK